MRRATAALTLTVMIASAACSGGGKHGARKATVGATPGFAPDNTATTVAGALSDGGATAGPAGAATARGRPGSATIAPTTTAPRAARPGPQPTPLDALKEFAAALGSGEYQRVTTVEEGPLVALATIEDLNRAWVRQQGADVSVSSNATGLTITQESGDRATGMGRVDVFTRSGNSQATERFDGPFALARGSGGWRVFDAVYNGAPLAAREVRQVQNMGGLLVRLTSVLDYGQTTSTLFTVGNTGGGDAKVYVEGAALVRGGKEYYPQFAVLDQINTGQLEGYVGFVRGPGAVTEVRLRFNREDQYVVFVFDF